MSNSLTKQFTYIFITTSVWWRLSIRIKTSSLIPPGRTLLKSNENELGLITSSIQSYSRGKSFSYQSDSDLSDS